MTEATKPKIGTDVFIAPGAYVGGDVTLGDQVTVMYQAVVRGDIAPIRVGSRVNFQDGAIVHTPYGVPLDMGDDIGVGHRAVVHCRSIGSCSLIGTGSILLDNVVIGSRCVIAAGSVIPPNTIIPDCSVVMGLPGEIVRRTNDDDLKLIDHVVKSYIEIGRQHALGRFANITPP